MSYETGPKPFNHDKSREKWSHPTDFLFACIGHAFKADTILFMPVILFRQLGFYAIIPYFLILVICVVPIIFIQSFIGQFSRTGFISVFRIAPLFKGVGYVSLALNLITLAYYSIFSAIPLVFFFYTLQPTIPWSCEGAKEWMTLEDDRISPCDRNKTSEDNYFMMKIPSVEFFRTRIDFTKTFDEPDFSWMMLLCCTLVWITVAFIAVKPVKTIGQFARYSCCAVIGILCLMLIRFLFLPGALHGLMQFFQPVNVQFPDAWFMLPCMALSTLGPGWGSIITMASFNDFKTKIYRFSWIVSFVQLGILLGMAFLSMLMWGFFYGFPEPFEKNAHDYIYSNHLSEFLVIPTGLTLMEVPHFWSLLFFAMLFLGSLTLLVVQLISVLTTLFDEYEELRSNKRTVSLATVAVLATSSLFFCTNHGLALLALLTKSSIMTQMFLNLFLLLVVLWVYGRERFQRDVFFMTGRVYSGLMVNLVRFVSPLFLIMGILAGLVFTVDQFFRQFSFIVFFTVTALTVIPWCLIPWYCIYKVKQTRGALSLRLKWYMKPMDWYPVDPAEKERYEETFSNVESTHQLTIPREEGAEEVLDATGTA